MSAAPTPYQSPPAPDELPVMTNDERTVACDAWAQLMIGNSSPFEAASATVRLHIFEASRLSLQNGDEPGTGNPFD